MPSRKSVYRLAYVFWMTLMFLMSAVYVKSCEAREWEGVVLHHTASAPGTTVDQVYQWHVRENGWRAIGYHYLITTDGVLHNTRPLEWDGAHALGRNKTHIGVCLVGYEDFTNEQIKTLDKLLQELNLPIESHHAQCPTTHWNELLRRLYTARWR